eukprot:ctg_4468.g738
MTRRTISAGQRRVAPDDAGGLRGESRARAIQHGTAAGATNAGTDGGARGAGGVAPLGGCQVRVRSTGDIGTVNAVHAPDQLVLQVEGAVAQQRTVSRDACEP